MTTQPLFMESAFLKDDDVFNTPPTPADAPVSDKPMSVSELSSALKNCIESRFGFVKIQGEISGLKKAASGHLYFALKDSDALIDAVCWRGTASKLTVTPEEGMEVVCTGKITAYPSRSKYQIVVDSMQVAGVGALLKLLEERRQKLAQEGLFDSGRKKKIPFLPNVIGVVTSPTGAVIRDIMHRITERFPTPVLLWSSLVQGEDAARQIAAGINGFNAIPPEGLTTPTGIIPRPDVIIVARGGGSLEDLWAFNEEIVVRAAANSKIPLISAVGHETDTTLIDYASDLRAPTPTGAAEKAVPVRMEIATRLNRLNTRMISAATQILEGDKNILTGLARGLPPLDRILGEYALKVDERGERLHNALTALITRRQLVLEQTANRLKRPETVLANAQTALLKSAQPLKMLGTDIIKSLENRLTTAARILETCSYKRILERGFALVTDDGGKPVVSAEKAAVLKNMSLIFSNGTVTVHTDAFKPPKQKKSHPAEDDKQGTLL